MDNNKTSKDFSKNYMEWVKQSNLSDLTNTEHKFAEWLLLEENIKIISQIGGLNAIFASVRHYLKSGQFKGNNAK